jgi:hypothetical protein
MNMPMHDITHVQTSSSDANVQHIATFSTTCYARRASTLGIPVFLSKTPSHCGMQSKIPCCSQSVSASHYQVLHLTLITLSLTESLTSTMELALELLQEAVSHRRRLRRLVGWRRSLFSGRPLRNEHHHGHLQGGPGHRRDRALPLHSPYKRWQCAWRPSAVLKR